LQSRKSQYCLQHRDLFGGFQDLVNGNIPNPEDPSNSEISSLALKRFALSPSVIADLQIAIEDGGFKPVAYTEFKSQFTLDDLSHDNKSSWRSMLVYFGAFTFDADNPETHIRIPNRVALKRFATTVLKGYDIARSLLVGLQNLISNGNIQQPLSCYRDLIVQRDRTIDDLTQKSEENHRDTFYFCMRLSHVLGSRVEFEVKKATNMPGYVDLLFQTSKFLIITEWKFYRINYLNIPGNTDALSKAATLHGYTLEQILNTRFYQWDKYHRGTIRDQAQREAPQLMSYVQSETVQEKVAGRKLRAHLVIIVGSRHILLWDMNSEGKLAEEPCLVGGYMA